MEKCKRDSAKAVPNVTAAADSMEKAFAIPEISPAPKLSFLALTLQNGSGEVVSSNLYWLPAFDWDLEHTICTLITQQCPI